MRNFRVMGSAFFLLLAGAVFADTPVSFMRPVCIQESEFLEIEFRTLPSDAIPDTSDQDFIKERVIAWAKSGFLLMGNGSSWECELSESTFRVEFKQEAPRPRGMCGASPRLLISVSKDSEEWISDVTFGSDCFRGPYITRFSIFNYPNQNHLGRMEFCYKTSTFGERFCEHWHDAWSQGISQKIPITIGKFSEIVKKREHLETQKQR